MGIQLRVGWSERLYTVTRISSGCLLRGRVGALNIKSLSSEYGTRMLFEARFWPWRSGQRRENPLEMVSFCLESGPQPSTLNTQHSTPQQLQEAAAGGLHGGGVGALERALTRDPSHPGLKQTQIKKTKNIIRFVFPHTPHLEPVIPNPTSQTLHPKPTLQSHNSKRYTLGPTGQALEIKYQASNTKLSTTTPRFQTPIPTSKTPNLKPQTADPKPQAPDPRPQTPHPQAGQGCGRTVHGAVNLTNPDPNSNSNRFRARREKLQTF